MIYVLDCEGNPLMPTKRYGKVRHLLKNNKAKIVKRDPYLTIQLQYPSDKYIQPLKAGMDIGDTIGISVVREYTELLSSEIKTRSKKIPSNLKDRSTYRRTRRNKLRYREKRFDNRAASKGKCKVCGGNLPSAIKTKKKKSKKKVIINKKLIIHEICCSCMRKSDGNHHVYKDTKKTFDKYRYAPSVKHQINTHFTLIDKINSILPLKEENWIIEKSKFDIQKMENHEINGIGYQQGNLWGFTSIREFVLERDNHECQNPNCKHKKNKTKGNIYLNKKITLVLHHIIYKSKGGTDKVNNLITLCVDCHTTKNHQKGHFLWNWCVNSKKINSNYKSATKMNVIANSFYVNKNVMFTYGAETKRKRKLLDLEKTHANDAYVITINNDAFEVVKDEKENDILKLKKDININKIDKPTMIIQTNGRENGRRSLATFIDSKVIDIRDGNVKYGKELANETRSKNNKEQKNKNNKEQKNKNNRIYRFKYVREGSIDKRKGKSKFSNGSIIEFTHEGKKYIRQCRGMTGNNIYIKNFNKKTITERKYKAKLITPRKGLIVEK